MKWDCGPDWAEKKKMLEDWHPFFCLWPRRIASHDCRWLEWVERRGEFFYDGWDSDWTWEYRAKGSGTTDG